MTPEFLARVSELQTSWQKAKAAAKLVGIEKPEDKTWDEMAEAIATAEFAKAGKPIELEIQESAPEIPGKTDEMVRATNAAATPAIELEPPVVTGKYATEYFAKVGIPYCKTCGAQHQKGRGGVPICPEARPNCPRLKGTLTNG